MSSHEDLATEGLGRMFDEGKNDTRCDGDKNLEDGLTPSTDVAEKSGEKHEGMSKRMKRKMVKQERWLQHKPEKRKLEREKKKARKRKQREAGVVAVAVSRKKLRDNRMANSECKLRVAIDCSFDDLMTDREINSLGSQIQYSYSANRRSENPLQLYVTSLGSATKKRLDSVGDYSGWDVHFKEESYVDLFEKDDVVYLSSDSPNVLEKLEESKVYIIGGLVDHNKHKGVCHRTAVDQGIYHAQLPIGQYLHLETRKVLAVNHVFEILLQWTISEDWEKAFFHVIPKRKGLSCRDKTEESPSSNQKSSGGKIENSAMEDGKMDRDTSSEAECGEGGGDKRSVCESDGCKSDAKHAQDVQKLGNPLSDKISKDS